MRSWIFEQVEVEIKATTPLSSCKMPKVRDSGWARWDSFEMDRKSDAI